MFQCLGVPRVVPEHKIAKTEFLLKHASSLSLFGEGIILSLEHIQLEFVSRTSVLSLHYGSCAGLETK